MILLADLQAARILNIRQYPRSDIASAALTQIQAKVAQVRNDLPPEA